MLIQLNTAPAFSDTVIKAAHAILTVDVIYYDENQKEAVVVAGTAVIVDTVRGVGLVDGRHMRLDRHEYSIFA